MAEKIEEGETAEKGGEQTDFEKDAVVVEKTEAEQQTDAVPDKAPSIPPLPEIPEKATYVLIGGGTASFAAYRAIRKGDPKAQVDKMMMLNYIVFS